MTIVLRHASLSREAKEEAKLMPVDSKSEWSNDDTSLFRFLFNFTWFFQAFMSDI